MVFFELKRSLRAASCCRRLVMNGATGLRRFSLRSMVWTTKSLPWMSWTIRVASVSDGSTASWPFTLCSFASKGGGCAPARVAVIDQYSSERNASRSLSRSQISMSATDWTRPMLKPRRTFFQSSWLP